MPKQFKVLCRNYPECPPAIPWAMVEPHENQAIRNHGQSLERLDERGGLSPEELYAVLRDAPFETIGRQTAVQFLLAETENFREKEQ
jgi:hypothetical protein